MRNQLTIRIEKPFVKLVARVLLRQAAELALTVAGIRHPVELGLVIAGDDTVHELNLKYRGVDDTTDVLAFALSQPPGSKAMPFITPPDNVVHLGEVIVSYPQANRQAEEQQHSVEQELALLVAHGVLHLLGYDHESSQDEQKMRAMERKVMETIAAKGKS